MLEHLGYEKHDPTGAGTSSIRNGTGTKTVLTEASGHLEVDVPATARTFEPQTLKKRQSRQNSVDEIVLSFYATDDG
jgi:putative transposase